MADTGRRGRTYGSGAARPSLGHLTHWRLAHHGLPVQPPGGAATGCPAVLGPAPLAGAGDRDAAGHAEGRRGGVGCGFDLGVGNDDGAEAEAHDASAVDEKDTEAGEVAAAAGEAGGIQRHAATAPNAVHSLRAPCRGRAVESCSERPKREPSICVQVPRQQAGTLPRPMLTVC